MARSKIAFIIAAGLIVVVGPIVYVCLFGPQTAMAVEARWMTQKAPSVSKFPVPLPDTSVSSTPHKEVSYFGYELELPWDDVDETKSKTFDKIRVTAFQSGNSFFLSIFPPNSFVKELTKDYKIDADTFRRAYGEHATESDYGFYSRMLAVTPDSIGPFMTQSEDGGNLSLLVIKAIATPEADSGIFEIRSGDYRGFQFESADGRPARIIDDLYSADEGIELHFSQKAGGSAPNITQPEINRVLQSIHKIPASSDAVAK